MKITHCIFDMDGLLLDTERIYYEVTAEILGRYGKTYTWELRSLSLGLRQYDSADLLVRKTGIPMSVEELMKERNEKNIERFPTARPMPGVMRLIKHLKAHNIPMAVATSSSRDNFAIKSLNNQELFNMFDSITCGDDPNVKNGKPAPDLFLSAWKSMGNPPLDQCLVFEDAINGIRAAKNAGMHVVWVPDPNIALLNPGNNDADEIISSLEDFDPAKYELPPFCD
ncbi:pseudouridine-5'-phosphatase [Rhizophagus clarus]|uniref:Pseudouridine-5'-phosphatase n=2 Tax=Rhizophagus clarus TaxID=94130 RepID=A0A8H3LIW9_9GLOM|nr:pseudouridine-5'-phosphatase [Rhizophagus clarus]